jgi:hypothetical protein
LISRRWLSRAAAGAGLFAAALVGGAPGWAGSSSENATIQADTLPVTAAAFSAKAAAKVAGTVCQPLATEDVWYFATVPPSPGTRETTPPGETPPAVSAPAVSALPAQGGARPGFLSVTLTFAVADVLEPRVKTIGPDGIDVMGIASIRTPPGWTLIDATAEVSAAPSATPKPTTAPTAPTATTATPAPTATTAPIATTAPNATTPPTAAEATSAPRATPAPEATKGATQPPGARPQAWSFALVGTCPARTAGQLFVPAPPPTTKAARRSAVPTARPVVSNAGGPADAAPVAFAAANAANDLPMTGPDVVGMLTLGVTLVAAGGLLIIVRRQRDKPIPQPKPSDWY